MGSIARRREIVVAIIRYQVSNSASVQGLGRQQLRKPTCRDRKQSNDLGVAFIIQVGKFPNLAYSHSAASFFEGWDPPPSDELLSNAR
jgi:hypothetical protein